MFDKLQRPLPLANIFLPDLLDCSRAYLQDYDWGNWNEYPDFSIGAETTSISVTSGDFQIYRNQNQYFTYKEAEKLESMEGIKKVNKKVYSDGISLNLTKDEMDRYWKQFYEKQDSMTNIMPDHGMTPIYNIDFLVLNRKELKELKKEFPQYSWENLKKKNTCMMFLPKVGNGESNKKEAEKDAIFEKVEYDSKLDLQELKRSDLKERLYKKSISQIVPGNLNSTKLDISLSDEKPTVVLLEENAGDMIKGYSGLEVYLKSNISVEQYKKIENMMRDMAVNHTDFYWFSKQEQQAESKNIHHCIEIPCVLFSIVIFIFLYFLKYFSYIIHLQRIRSSIYIFWVYGMKKEEMCKAILMELCFYEVVVLGLSFVNVSIILWIIAFETVFNYF